MQVALMMVSPILFGIANVSTGKLNAMFNLVLQIKSILSSLSNARERVRIAVYLINRLADLLNESRDKLIQQAVRSVPSSFFLAPRWYVSTFPI